MIEKILNSFSERRPFVCLATGPSLALEDINYVKDKCHTIAVNDAFRLANWCDILYSCDKKWWDSHNGVPHFPGFKISLEKTVYKDVFSLTQGKRFGLSYTWPIVCTGDNSGYQAVNLAVLLGAKKIILLGYDMGYGKDGKKHFFGDHKTLLNPREEKLKLWASYFGRLKKELTSDIEIINCSCVSMITCFERKKLEEVL